MGKRVLSRFTNGKKMGAFVLCSLCVGCVFAYLDTNNERNANGLGVFYTHNPLSHNTSVSKWYSPPWRDFYLAIIFHLRATGKPLVANENRGNRGFFELLHFQSQI